MYAFLQGYRQDGTKPKSKEKSHGEKTVPKSPKKFTVREEKQTRLITYSAKTAAPTTAPATIAPTEPALKAFMCVAALKLVGDVDDDAAELDAEPEPEPEGVDEAATVRPKELLLAAEVAAALPVPEALAALEAELAGAEVLDAIVVDAAAMEKPPLVANTSLMLVILTASRV